jgi:hypothetical protein
MLEKLEEDSKLEDNASKHTGNLAQTFINNVGLVMVNIK